jgi:hypothetical protein
MCYWLKFKSFILKFMFAVIRQACNTNTKYAVKERMFFGDTCMYVKENDKISLIFCWPCIIVYQYSETNVMQFLFNLLSIMGLYVFRWWSQLPFV